MIINMALKSLVNRFFQSHNILNKFYSPDNLTEYREPVTPLGRMEGFLNSCKEKLFTPHNL
jgi:hypothetical protein